MKSFVALSALILAVCVVSSQCKSLGFGNRNTNINKNSNDNFSDDFLSSFLESMLNQGRKAKSVAKAAAVPPPVAVIESKSAVAKSTATDESPAIAVSRSLADSTAQQQEDQRAFDEFETMFDEDSFDEMSAFDDSEQEESPFSAAQLKFFQSLMKA